jgi:hypothetical protein
MLSWGYAVYISRAWPTVFTFISKMYDLAAVLAAGSDL